MCHEREVVVEFLAIMTGSRCKRKGPLFQDFPEITPCFFLQRPSVPVSSSTVELWLPHELRCTTGPPRMAGLAGLRGWCHRTGERLDGAGRNSATSQSMSAPLTFSFECCNWRE